MRAIDRIEQTGFRRRRAEAMAAEIMREIEDVVPDVDRRAVYERLRWVLHENGAAWTTDEERERMGFEARDALGWTASERVEYERKRTEAMQMLMVSIFSAAPE